jgi:tetratricopeptide (TPR) repeat protein
LSRIDWLKTLGWTEDQLEDLRYVGFAYIRQGKYEIAVPIFEALCVLDKENAYDAQTLGALHLQLGNPNKALKYFDRALKIDADHAPTLLNLTKTFFMLGKKQEGLKLANILQNEPNPFIANTAKALILAYS